MQCLCLDHKRKRHQGSFWFVIKLLTETMLSLTVNMSWLPEFFVCCCLLVEILRNSHFWLEKVGLFQMIRTGPRFACKVTERLSGSWATSTTTQIFLETQIFQRTFCLLDTHKQQLGTKTLENQTFSQSEDVLLPQRLYFHVGMLNALHGDITSQLMHDHCWLLLCFFFMPIDLCNSSVHSLHLHLSP